MKKVALIVHACDRYQFLYRGFEHFFLKYWDFNINCKYYLATEDIDITIANFENIKSGRGAWADRLVKLLKEEIQEDYVLYFQEDMWLNKKVNGNFFNQLFEISTENNWNQVKLHSSEVYTTSSSEFFIEGFNISIIDNIKSGYLMSHQVTLWKKDFLTAQLYKDEHPWRNERRGTKRLKQLNPVIYHADYFAENGSPEINKNKNPIGRSKYHTVSLNGALNSNIGLYIPELESADSDARQYAKDLQYHYENKLTHDGKPKPRKEDIFKKIKKVFTK